MSSNTYRGKCVWSRCRCIRYNKNPTSISSNPDICNCGHGHIWHEITSESELESLDLNVRTTSIPTSPAPPRNKSIVSNLPVSPKIKTDMSPRENLCIACDNEDKTIVIYPCLHLCMCETCFNRWYPNNTSCPMCRGEISRFEKVIV